MLGKLLEHVEGSQANRDNLTKLCNRAVGLADLLLGRLQAGGLVGPAYRSLISRLNDVLEVCGGGGRGGGSEGISAHAPCCCATVLLSSICVHWPPPHSPSTIVTTTTTIATTTTTTIATTHHHHHHRHRRWTATARATATQAGWCASWSMRAMRRTTSGWPRSCGISR